LVVGYMYPSLSTRERAFATVLCPATKYCLYEHPLTRSDDNQHLKKDR
jgi:hypothetical protein